MLDEIRKKLQDGHYVIPAHIAPEEPKSLKEYGYLRFQLGNEEFAKLHPEIDRELKDYFIKLEAYNCSNQRNVLLEDKFYADLREAVKQELKVETLPDEAWNVLLEHSHYDPEYGSSFENHLEGLAELIVTIDIIADNRKK